MNFLKMFFASLLAMVLFTVLMLFFVFGYIGGKASRSMPKVHSRSVLVLDLGQVFMEQAQDPFPLFSDGMPGVYDVVRLLAKAKTDKNISGLYIVANGNPNGFATSEEFRNAIMDFKKSGKFVFAHGDMISQKAYSVANAADSIYLSPQGYMEWYGFNVDYVFLKGTLEKLQIEPQVFYA